MYDDMIREEAKKETMEYIRACLQARLDGNSYPKEPEFMQLVDRIVQKESNCAKEAKSGR